jgi:hypothetical protein
MLTACQSRLNLRSNGGATAPLHNPALRTPSLPGMARKCRDFSLFLEESRTPLIARMASPLFEIGLVFVRLDHIARFIVNANHSIM